MSLDILDFMLILAFGPLDWSFPEWLWVLAIINTLSPIAVRRKRRRGE